MKRILNLLRWSPNIQLGPLEQQLLSALWMRGSSTVREILAAGDIKLAYTTVMTTLDRLYKKQLLNRAADGRAFRYSPRYTQARTRESGDRRDHPATARLKRGSLASSFLLGGSSQRTRCSSAG